MPEQQPLVEVHEPRGPAQVVLRQVPLAQRPEQHVVPVLQVPPVPVQADERHVPPEHSSPAQQSDDKMHVAPVAPQAVALRQMLAEHVPEQQSVVAAQVRPLRRQAALRQMPPEQTFEQHDEAREQVPPVPVQADERHVPPEHSSPAQQSPESVHAAPVEPQTAVLRQTPPEHVPEQQSAVTAQADPLARQAALRQRLAEQRFEQHEDESEQAPPVEVHVDARHCPRLQVSPAQQSEARAQVPPAP